MRAQPLYLLSNTNITIREAAQRIGFSVYCYCINIFVVNLFMCVRSIC